ncbi:MAG: aminotransferase class V-fold PLP-dependent enzyme [Oscillospiraceae bacterium]|nr:aminotransferase class V-fold PLP-dependent enzyme [Oscillospiraceae bacterium]
MIYLDSAATSFQKPPSVLQAVENTLRHAASPGRGAYGAAMRAAATMLQMREDAAEFFRFPDPERIVMTMNATHALNLAIRSLISPGDRVVISGFEHNAVLRPLYAAGAEIIVVGRKLFDSSDLVAEFRKALGGAKAAVCTHVSNVFGYILPIDEISKLCEKQGVPLIIDASQSAGVLDLDCRQIKADFFAMPGHKSLLGVPGSGILLCNGDVSPLLYGGSGGDSINRDMPAYLPDRLEAGTQNAPAAAAMSAGIRYIRKVGRAVIEEHEKELMRHMSLLLQKQDEIEQFVSSEKNASGVLSFRARNRDCEEIAERLGEQGICVRSGLHCAPLAHESAGTLKTGTVRMSFSPFNTHAEVEKTASKLIKII